MSMASERIPVFSRRTFSFSNLAANESLAYVMQRAVPVEAFAAGTLLVRIHTINVASGAQIEVRGTPVAPSADEPETDFLLDTSSAKVVLDSNDAAGTLRLDPLLPGFGTHLQLVVEGRQLTASPVTVTAELSAELVMKEACAEPPTLREHSRHIYDRTSADLAYIPFAGTAEGTSISSATNVLRMVAPYDGYLESVLVYTTGSSGSTTVGLHLDNNATASATATETVSASTAKRFTFGPAASFVQGNLLSISIDPTNAPNDVNVECVWVYKTGA